MKHIKIQISRTSRSDLLCIACGMFRTEWEIYNGGEPQVGIHTRCAAAIKVSRKASAKSEPLEIVEEPSSENSSTHTGIADAIAGRLAQRTEEAFAYPQKQMRMNLEPGERCSEGGSCNFVADIEFDASGESKSCSKCGREP